MQPSTNLPEPLLSKYRLNQIEDLKELKERIGEELYRSMWNAVCLNLRTMKPGQTFYYQKYFTGSKLEPFIKLACYFIYCNMDWEFLDDYSAIRRQ